MNKAIKYRIYPTKEQEILFLKTFGCCRKVWNLMLADKISYYQKEKKTLTTTPAKYKAEFAFLKEVDSLALANVQLNLQKAYNNCFDKKYKRNTGFPKFKSRKHCKKSYTTNNQKGSIAIIDDKHIRLPKVGIVKAVIHRMPEPNWVLKSTTISQDPDGKYYISVLFEYDKVIIPVPLSDNALGLDYKSASLYMDSNGNLGSNHKYYSESHKKLARAQRKLSKRYGSRKGEHPSNNYKKQQLKVNKIHKKIANQRLDNLHKTSTGIANQYDVVSAEDLDMRAMSNKGFGNGKATMDNGYGMFLNMLDYKLRDRGKYFVRIDRWYPSSQICSHCGQVHKLSLNERIYRCECGLTIDRDLNAAINIRNEGLRILKEQYQNVG